METVWEVTLLKLTDNGNEWFKVTRRLPGRGVAETKVFTSSAQLGNKFLHGCVDFFFECLFEFGLVVRVYVWNVKDDNLFFEVFFRERLSKPLSLVLFHDEHSLCPLHILFRNDVAIDASISCFREQFGSGPATVHTLIADEKELHTGLGMNGLI